MFVECRLSWLDDVDDNFALVGADFHAVTTVFSSLSVSCWSSSSLPPDKSMSSANPKLQSGCPPMDAGEILVLTIDGNLPCIGTVKSRAPLLLGLRKWAGIDERIGDYMVESCMGTNFSPHPQPSPIILYPSP